jgi:hypothetical protein
MKESEKTSGKVVDGDEAALHASGGEIQTPSRAAVASEEQIRMRAYELYRERGGKVGDDTGDWLRAEREYREQGSKGTAEAAAPHDDADADADAIQPNPPRTTIGGWFTAPKFGSSGSGGLELEPGPERD